MTTQKILKTFTDKIMLWVLSEILKTAILLISMQFYVEVIIGVGKSNCILILFQFLSLYYTYIRSHHNTIRF